MTREPIRMRYRLTENSRDVLVGPVDRSIMTIAPLDSVDERIRRAIAEKRLLEIRHKRAVRLVEPHDYGVIDGTERLLIFQLHGPDSGKVPSAGACSMSSRSRAA